MVGNFERTSLDEVSFCQISRRGFGKSLFNMGLKVSSDIRSQFTNFGTSRFDKSPKERSQLHLVGLYLGTVHLTGVEKYIHYPFFE